MLEFEIAIDPPPESLRWSRDSFDNIVGTASFSGRASELRFESVVRVAQSLSHSGSLEVAEVRFPLHFRQHEFREDSGGDGQFRGGLGVALDLVLETEKPALGNTAGDGVRHGPCGMLGGEDGVPHDYRLISEGRPPRPLRTKEVGIELHPGDCLEIRSSGGGGWGPPARRSPQARAHDREQGLVTNSITTGQKSQ